MKYELRFCYQTGFGNENPLLTHFQTITQGFPNDYPPFPNDYSETGGFPNDYFPGKSSEKQKNRKRQIRGRMDAHEIIES